MLNGQLIDLYFLTPSLWVVHSLPSFFIFSLHPLANLFSLARPLLLNSERPICSCASLEHILRMTHTLWNKEPHEALTRKFWISSAFIFAPSPGLNHRTPSCSAFSCSVICRRAKADNRIMIWLMDIKRRLFVSLPNDSRVDAVLFKVESKRL